MNKMMFPLVLASLPVMLSACSPASDGTNGSDNANAVVEANGAAPEGNATGEVGSNEIVAGNAVATEGAGQAIEVMLEKVQNIPETPNDQVNVSDVRFVTGIGGNFITAKVQYGGGCRPHEFKAYWTGAWNKSNPPGIAIVLRHNANGDTCHALFTRLVQINIAEPAAAERRFWVELSGPNGSAGRVDVRIP